jgi:ABC-type anion transport system duplicated permease subunit
MGNSPSSHRATSNSNTAPTAPQPPAPPPPPPPSTPSTGTSTYTGPLVPDQEKEQIALEDARIKTQEYAQRYVELSNQYTHQKTTLDTINAAKNKVAGIDKDLSFSVKTFGKQVSDIENQINIDKQKIDIVKTNWFDKILNALIVLALVFAIYSVGKALYHRAVSSVSSIVGSQ